MTVRVSRATLVALIAAAVPAGVVYADDDPNASFTFAPSQPVQGEVVTFTSTSTDPNNDIHQTNWDLDNDGSYDDGSGTTASRSYTCSSPSVSCSRTVRLRVRDSDNNVDTTSRTFTVKPNTAPTAQFTWSPNSPLTNQQLTLTSTSSDPDGRPLTQRWNTDSDGSYDDGTGQQISVSFHQNGVRTIGLQVTDSGGTVRTISHNITIRNRAPQASFNVSAEAVDTGDPIQFTSTSSDPDGSIKSAEWDFNGDGTTDATGSSVSRSFPDNGEPTITLKVTDDDNDSATSSRKVTIKNRPPVADFQSSATEVDTGDPVQFTSTSSDPDGQIKSSQWDFDGNGSTDATGSQVSHAFGNDGTHSVTLTVTDDDGASRSTSREVKANNKPPSASFTYSPAQPHAGDEVVLTGGGQDPDGKVVEYRWDLDGDGQFDDAVGQEVRTVFDEPGTYTVGLRVRDDDGRQSPPTFDSIEVTPRPAPPPPPAGGGSQPGSTPGSGTAIGPFLVSPFPSVRIRGVTTSTGARIDLLGVRTPGATRILVRCRGGGCPWRSKRLVARFPASQVRVVKIPQFKARRLRAGAVVEIFVTQAGRIGKYTRFRIRRAKPPARVDRCTVPGAARVRSCPA